MPPINAELKSFSQDDVDEIEKVLAEGREVRAARRKAKPRDMETLSSIDEIDADAVFAKFNGKAK